MKKFSVAVLVAVILVVSIGFVGIEMLGMSHPFTDSGEASIPILMYHNVSPWVPSFSDENKFVTVKPEDFAAKTIDYLVKNAESLKRSATVMNNVAMRAYINSTLTIQEIMQSGTAVKDAYLQNGLKWVTSGTYNGSEGTWELVLDVATQTIIHFQFRSH